MYIQMALREAHPVGNNFIYHSCSLYDRHVAVLFYCATHVANFYYNLFFFPGHTISRQQHGALITTRISQTCACWIIWYHSGIVQNAREIVGETFLTFGSVLAHVTSLDMHAKCNNCTLRKRIIILSIIKRDNRHFARGRSHLRVYKESRTFSSRFKKSLLLHDDFQRNHQNALKYTFLIVSSLHSKQIVNYAIYVIDTLFFLPTKLYNI